MTKTDKQSRIDKIIVLTLILGGLAIYLLYILPDSFRFAIIFFVILIFSIIVAFIKYSDSELIISSSDAKENFSYIDQDQSIGYTENKETIDSIIQSIDKNIMKKTPDSIIGIFFVGIFAAILLSFIHPIIGAITSIGFSIAMLAVMDANFNLHNNQIKHLLKLINKD